MRFIIENWRKYLEEAPEAIDAITGQGTPEGRQDSINYFWDNGEEYISDEGDYARFNKKNRRDIGPWSGPGEVVTFEDPSGETTFYFVVDAGRPTFYIAATPHEDGVAVGNVRKSGGGFRVTDFYKWLIERHGVLYSDTQQTPMGKKIWDRLSAEDGIEVIEAEDGRLKAIQI